MRLTATVALSAVLSALPAYGLFGIHLPSIPIVDNLLGGGGLNVANVLVTNLGLNNCGTGSFLSQLTGKCTGLPTCAADRLVVGGKSTLLDVFTNTCISLDQCIALGNAQVIQVPGVLNGQTAAGLTVGVCRRNDCPSGQVLNSSGVCAPNAPVKTCPIFQKLVGDDCVDKTCQDSFLLNKVTGVCDLCDSSKNLYIVAGVCKLVECTNTFVFNRVTGKCECPTGTSLVDSLGKCLLSPNCNLSLEVPKLVGSVLDCVCKTGFTLGIHGLCIPIALCPIGQTYDYTLSRCVHRLLPRKELQGVYEQYKE